MPMHLSISRMSPSPAAAAPGLLQASTLSHSALKVTLRPRLRSSPAHCTDQRLSNSKHRHHITHRPHFLNLQHTHAPRTAAARSNNARDEPDQHATRRALLPAVKSHSVRGSSARAEQPAGTVPGTPRSIPGRSASRRPPAAVALGGKLWNP